MASDKIDEILHELDKGFGLAFAMIPDDKKAAFTKATALGYMDIDPANNYCLSRIGQQIVNSGLSYREWEAKNSKPDGTGRLDNDMDSLSAGASDISLSSESLAGDSAGNPGEKPAKKPWWKIFG